jgi:hypothetical protein
MANMGQMKNPAMMAAQMQRDGSNMDMNGQRPQSPGPNENAPSPNKRPRMEGMSIPTAGALNDRELTLRAYRRNEQWHARKPIC